MDVGRSCLAGFKSKCKYKQRYRSTIPREGPVFGMKPRWNQIRSETNKIHTTTKTTKATKSLKQFHHGICTQRNVCYVWTRTKKLSDFSTFSKSGAFQNAPRHQVIPPGYIARPVLQHPNLDWYHLAFIRFYLQQVFGSGSVICLGYPQFLWEASSPMLKVCIKSLFPEAKLNVEYPWLCPEHSAS